MIFLYLPFPLSQLDQRPVYWKLARCQRVTPSHPSSRPVRNLSGASKILHLVAEFSNGIIPSSLFAVFFAFVVVLGFIVKLGDCCWQVGGGGRGDACSELELVRLRDS